MPLTREQLDGTDPADTVNIFVRDYGVSFNEDECWITVDAGHLGLLRLRSDWRIAGALTWLLAKGKCERDKLCEESA